MAQMTGGYAFPEFLADTEWLAEHMSDENIRIVHTDVVDAYQRGHIPGAVMVPDNYEKDPDTKRVHILPPDRFAEMVESLGIGDDTLVVAYDNSRSLYAGRLWWALRYYGHDDVKVLNGGWRKWLREGRSVSIDAADLREGVRFTPAPDESLIVGTEELAWIHDRPDVAVWDVRSRREYTGENTRGNRRPGHIPGASHLEWLELMDLETHTFKPAEEMRRILESKGITPEKEVVAH
jgi:thiosulfate/3-mercaptopyruvate sulfurtransferase